MGKGNGGWKSRCCLYAHLRTSLIYARRTGNQDAKGGLHSVIEPAIALTMSLSRQLPNKWAVSSTYGGRPLLSTGCDMSICTLMRTTSAPPTSYPGSITNLRRNEQRVPFMGQAGRDITGVKVGLAWWLPCCRTWLHYRVLAASFSLSRCTRGFSEQAWPFVVLLVGRLALGSSIVCTTHRVETVQNAGRRVGESLQVPGHPVIFEMQPPAQVPRTSLTRPQAVGGINNCTSMFRQ